MKKHRTPVLVLEVTEGTLEELANQLEKSFQKLTPEEQKQFQNEARKAITGKPYEENKWLM